jgi:uncharacterized protein YebE (UPF0316 family)
MESILLPDSWLFTWVILPVLIFLARIGDVSIGTLRLIFISRGFKYYAPLLGFFEVIIWLLAIGQIMQHLDNFMCYIAYGLGFATGNFVGILLDEKLSLGTVLVRIVLKRDIEDLIIRLHDEEFGASVVDIEGMSGRQKMIFAVIKREDLRQVMTIINENHPDAFVTIEDVKTAQEGYFRMTRRKLNPISILQDFRKGK